MSQVSRSGKSDEAMKNSDKGCSIFVGEICMHQKYLSLGGVPCVNAISRTPIVNSDELIEMFKQLQQT